MEDLEDVERKAKESAELFERERKRKLNEAIKNNDIYYISRNISTIDLIKITIKKLQNKLTAK